MHKQKTLQAIVLGFYMNLNKWEIISRLAFVLIIIIYIIASGCAQTSILEFSNLKWNDCDNNTWQENISDGHINPPSLSSAPLENSGKSSICLDVAGPAIISFWWRTDAKKLHLGELSFWVNGSKRYVCDSSTWKYESYSLRGDNNYALRWEFLKFKSYPKSNGRGWIDDVSITPIPGQGQSDLSSSRIKSKTYNPLIRDLRNSSNKSIAKELLNTNEIYADKLENNVAYVGQVDDPKIKTYSSINRAIQNVEKDGTVIVPSGTYRENIIIDKPITLIGERESNTFLVSDNSIIYISGDNVIIKGFTIIGGDIGIYAVGASSCVIEDNTMYNNRLYGVYLDDCINVSVMRNNISDAGDTGIFLVGSYSCLIAQNIISDSLLSICIGSSTYGSFKNVICNNTLLHSSKGIKIFPKSNSNRICGGVDRNYFVNISNCDIYVPDSNKSLNTYPSDCTTTSDGCRKCSILIGQL